MEVMVPPLAGHAVLVLLLQLAGLLFLARLLAEGMRRIGQPAVMGELLAGIVLGPTLLGHFAPGVFAWAFPPDELQFHLLEAVSWLGMVLLLLLSGIETDVRAIRSLGRATAMTSLFALVVPFAGGFALGWFLPDDFLADPGQRTVFAAFLATAMAVSALPVIAKVLLDLNLMRRNVGLVTLSAGVVDDTIVWLVLSVIAGLAAGGSISAGEIGLTLVFLAAFLAAARWVAYPALARTVRFVNERVDLAGADLTLIIGFTFLAAGVSESMGVHAVFGAFVAGLVVRQIPRVKTSTMHALDVFIVSVLSPITFAFVGLKVDLWALSGWELPTLVMVVAVAGKVVGSYVGGRLGRLSHWESLAVGFGMNARGEMGLIVALIGLTLGLLTQEMFSTLVMMAVLTSFMAPVLIRWTLPRLPLSADERRRLEDTGRAGLIPAGPIRVLVPTAGGSNALGAFRLAGPLAHRDGGQVVAIFVQTGDGARKRGWSRRESLAGTNLDAHLEQAATVVGDDRLGVRRVRGVEVSEAILTEAERDYDLLLLGAAPHGPLHDPLTLELVRSADLPVVIVNHRPETDGTPFRRVLVPVDGSLFSRYAAELAFAYAGPAGATVALLHVVDENRFAAGSLPVPEPRDARPIRGARRRAVEAQLKQTFDPIAAVHDVAYSTRILSGGAPGEIIMDAANSGDYDLLVLGAEDKMLGQPLFFGQGTGEMMERAGCTTAVVVPHITKNPAPRTAE